MDSVGENDIEEEQYQGSGLGVLRIDVDINDIGNIAAIVVGLIGIIKAKNEGIIPNEILMACQGNKAVTPKKSPQVTPKASPRKEQTSINKVQQFVSFFERYLVLDEKGTVGVTELRAAYNKATGGAETHVSFHRLIEEFMEETGHILTKKRMQKGVCYKGMRYAMQEEIKIPERCVE